MTCMQIFADHRPPPFLASSNTLHRSRPIVCSIRDQTPPPTSPKSSPPLHFVWCSILCKSTCKTIMDNNLDPPSNLEPSLVPPPPSFMLDGGESGSRGLITPQPPPPPMATGIGVGCGCDGGKVSGCGGGGGGGSGGGCGGGGCGGDRGGLVLILAGAVF